MRPGWVVQQVKKAGQDAHQWGLDPSVFFGGMPVEFVGVIGFVCVLFQKGCFRVLSVCGFGFDVDSEPQGRTLKEN